MFSGTAQSNHISTQIESAKGNNNIEKIDIPLSLILFAVLKLKQIQLGCWVVVQNSTLRLQKVDNMVSALDPLSKNFAETPRPC